MLLVYSIAASRLWTRWAQSSSTCCSAVTIEGRPPFPKSTSKVWLLFEGGCCSRAVLIRKFTVIMIKIDFKMLATVLSNNLPENGGEKEQRGSTSQCRGIFWTRDCAGGLDWLEMMREDVRTLSTVTNKSTKWQIFSCHFWTQFFLLGKCSVVNAELFCFFHDQVLFSDDSESQIFTETQFAFH